MPYRLCEEEKLLEQPVEQPCYCDDRLCGKEKNALCKYSYNRNITYGF